MRLRDLAPSGRYGPQVALVLSLVALFLAGVAIGLALR